MKKIIALSLILLMFIVPAIAESHITLSVGRLIAAGYTGDKARALVEKAENGEELTDFHNAVYDVYNTPSSENGLEGDHLHLYGTIKEYVHSGTKKEYIISIILQQDDGREWLVPCGYYKSGTTVGSAQGAASGTTVFDGLEGQYVEVYGQYMGLSKAYNDIPTVYIITYGGLFVVDSSLLIMTENANQEMCMDGIYSLDLLIGAKRCLRSSGYYNISGFIDK